ncbi:MAG: T9SS type A sorting domain-containing protein [Bacteroidales bacterium]
MKAYQSGLVTFLLVFCLIINLKAQIPAIQSLQIIPSNPIPTDTVKIISHSIFPSGGCPLTTSSLNINEANITVNAIHTISMLTVICYSTDTLTIGNLNAGSYKLIYNLSGSVPPANYDSDTILFDVLQSTAIQHLNKPKQQFEIYPNPVISEINISNNYSQDEKYDVEIYSMLGLKLETISNFSNKICINLHEVKDGIYLVVIKYNNKCVWMQKIIKNTK